jgi:C-terminal processing protease CtpA/Prc
MKLKLLWVLLPVAALALNLPAYAGKDKGNDKDPELAKARAELRAAEDELHRAASELARASHEAGKENSWSHAYEFLSNPRRAMLGVTVDDEHAKAGSDGVQVTGVTPGGGADKAGIKSGDLLLGVNGQALAAKPGEKEGPAYKLMKLMSKVAPGSPVKLDYERDGKRGKITVVAQRPDVGALLCSMHEGDDMDAVMPPMPPVAPVPPMPPMPPAAPMAAMPPVPPMPPMPPQALRWSAGGPSFQLAKLDDDLAYYFKTREGVLVVKAPKDGKLGLKGGDVIQKIGDRRTGDPREVLDAISERAPGEKLKLEVMRQGKLTQLDGVMPEN